MMKAYRNYYTHGTPALEAAERPSRIKGVYHAIRDSFLARSYGYNLPHRFPWCWWLGALHPGGLDWLRLDAMTLPAPVPGRAKRLLEIGCGAGYLLKRMETLGWDVEGVDFDQACVDAVQQRGIRCRCGDVREQNYPPASFHAVFMGNVVEHVYDPLSLLSFCYQILAPDGRIVIVTPNAASIGHARFGRDWRGLEPPRHLQLFTPQSLQETLKATGFAIESARTTNRGFWYLWGMSARIRQARLAGQESVAHPVRMLSPESLARQGVGRAIQWMAQQRGEELLTVGIKRAPTDGSGRDTAV
jgi:2-polyprenyl-3-methyl-5-hydroxy-6-metoxy-1,4-benzoquinol methylase